MGYTENIKKINYQNTMPLDSGNTSDTRENSVPMSVFVVKGNVPISDDEKGLTISRGVSATNTTVKASSLTFPEKSNDSTWKASAIDFVDYYQNGHSAQETYDYLRQYICENKDNSERIKSIVSSILALEYTTYDKNNGHGPITATNAEIFEKFLQGKETPNSVCSTIHDFMRDTLESCGIPAVVIAGHGVKNPEGHAALLYKLPGTSDNTYVWNNYGEPVQIKASNVIAAAKEVYKKGYSISAASFLTLFGSDSQFYEEYGFKEAAFGDEIDARETNKIGTFTNPKVNESSSFQTTPRYDQYGFILTSDLIQKVGDNTQVSGDIQYRVNNDSPMYNSSYSIGGKIGGTLDAEHFKLNGEALINYIEGESDVLNGWAPLKRTQNMTFMQEVSAESEMNLYQDPSLKIAAGIKATEKSGHNIGFPTTSFRGILEGGVRAEYSNGNFGLTSSLSGGYNMDLIRKDCINNDTAFTYTPKVNFNGTMQYRTNNYTTITGNLSGYYAKDNVLEHYGGSIGFNANYQPSSNTNLYGGVSGEIEKKHLNIGLFDETILNQATLAATGGVKLAKSFGMNIKYAAPIEALQNGTASFTMEYDY